jgi:hypothetical protein
VEALTRWFARWSCVRIRTKTYLNTMRLLKGQEQIMATLKDVQDGQTKERALVEKLAAIIKAQVPSGTLSAEDQAIVDSVAADQQTTLGEDPTTPTTPTT